MAKTHDLGRAFVQPIRIKKSTQRFHRAYTQETDYPFRRSNSLVVRIWGERGVVLGWWQRTGMEETEALLAALGAGTANGARMEPAHDVWHLDDPEDAAKARQHIAKHSLDLDEEWTTLTMLGLDE